MKISELETGDIMLYSSSNNNKGFQHWFEQLIKWTTHSNITHTAVILKDPTFIHPSLRGVYVWESGFEGSLDPQDNKIKFGVQITPIHHVLEIAKERNDIVCIRKIKNKTKTTFNDNILREIHQVVYDKPYDIFPYHMIEAVIKKNKTPQRTDRFFCSALVGYIYTKCGILHENTDWSIMTPNDFSLESQSLIYNSEIQLDSTISILN